jgi:prenyltransferase beta subunit
MTAAVKKGLASLGNNAGEVTDFVKSLINDDGGFRGRARDSDLYYTAFGLEILSASHIESDRPQILNYLKQFDDGISFDLIHLSCLLRCKANLGIDLYEKGRKDILLQRIEECLDKNPTAYNFFLALSSYHELDSTIPDTQAFIDRLTKLRTRSYAYANFPSLPIGTVPSTAAAIIVLDGLDEHVDNASVDWLMSRTSNMGGFIAVKGTPKPDLLSTATALHALVAVDGPIEDLREATHEFIMSLQRENGGFAGYPGDRVTDCEYTYYALLALGHLS